MVHIQNRSNDFTINYFSGQIVSKKQIHKGDIKFLHNMDNKLIISGEIFSGYSDVGDIGDLMLVTNVGDICL